MRTASLLVLATLVACGTPVVVADIDDVPSDELPPPPGPVDRTLTLSAPPMSSSGAATTFTVSGAAPGQVIRIYASIGGPGASRVCPKALSYNCVEIAPVLRVVSLRADAAGHLTFTGTLPDPSPQGTVWVQAVALRDVATSTHPNFSPIITFQVDDTPVDTGCDDLAWWTGADVDADGITDLPHRVIVTVQGNDQPRAPITADLNLRALLDAAGDTAPFDPGSVRVVRQDCATAFPEVPAQFADRLRALGQRADHISPAGDERGTVAFLFEADGDLTTADALPTGQTATFGVYFASTASGGVTPASPPTDLAVTLGATTTLANSLTAASFDPARGGLISNLSFLGSGTLSTETGSCCGNSMHYWNRVTQPGPPFGWITPQSAPGTLELLESGPVLAAVRATGVRTGTTTAGVTYGSYSYDHVYWLFAGRPEVHRSVTHVALLDSTTEHRDEASYGFRPLQIFHSVQLQTGVTYLTNPAGPWAAVTGTTWGLAAGLPVPPAQFARITNPPGPEIGQPADPRYLSFHGNEVVPPGVVSPVTIPAGTAYFDHIAAVLLPYAAPFDPHQPELERLMAGVSVSVSPVESTP